MLMMGYNPLKGKNYEETYQLNRECKINFSEQDIIEKYGKSGLEFLQRLLEKNPKKRVDAGDALELAFLKLQESEETKPSLNGNQ